MGVQMSDAIGTFEMKHTGSHYGRTDAGELVSNSNFEGTGTGYGVGFGTLTIIQPLSEANATSGKCTWSGQSFHEDGTTLGFLAEGTWEQTPGANQWTITLIANVANGDRIRCVGIAEFSSRTFAGEIFPA